MEHRDLVGHRQPRGAARTELTHRECWTARVEDAAFRMPDGHRGSRRTDAGFCSGRDRERHLGAPR